MRFTAYDRKVLLGALEDLAGGAWRRFEDALWLGFGDQWRPIVEHLRIQGYVEFGGAEKDEPRLTGKGPGLIEALRAESGVGSGVGSDAEAQLAAG